MLCHPPHDVPPPTDMPPPATGDTRERGLAAAIGCTNVYTINMHKQELKIRLGFTQQTVELRASANADVYTLCI